MRGLMTTAVAAVLLLAGSAQAQLIDATGIANGQIKQDTLILNFPPPTGYWSGSGEGGSVEAIVNIATQISFESGVAVSGGFAEATSWSGVDVTVFNNSDGVLSIENFGSTIIPAGMGFYLQERVGPAADNNIFTGYGQTTQLFTLADLESTTEGELAYSDFEFTVVSNETTLYSLSGSMSLSIDDGELQRNFNLDAASAALLGFTNTGHDQNISWAFAWDATHIVLPLNAYLESGQSQVIQYRTRVTSRTRAECLSATTCLVAYSGFGDPIGRGGGAEFDSASDSLFAGMQMASFDLPQINPITGIVFDPQQFNPFEIIDGGGAVPEPATWLTMILGFGMLGATLRRRRVLTYS